MQTFETPMSHLVKLGFLLFVAAWMAVTVWAFRSGIIWTSICIVATAGPLSVLAWYGLYAIPARSRIELHDGGLIVDAPPFFEHRVPYGEIKRAFVGDMKTDKTLAIDAPKRQVAFGGFREGIVKLANGQEAFVLTTGRKVVGLDLGGVYLLLGPAKFEAFKAALGEKVTLKG